MDLLAAAAGRSSPRRGIRHVTFDGRLEFHSITMRVSADVFLVSLLSLLP